MIHNHDRSAKYKENSLTLTGAVAMGTGVMIGAGIFEGDLIVIDRSLTPKHNNIVVAVIDNDFTVKRLWLKDKIELRPENPDYQPITLSGEVDMRIWGVVTAVVRKF